MMGPYSYFDASYLEDSNQPEFHTHDCMWSGDCYACQSSRVVLTDNGSGSLTTGPNEICLGETIPITVGGTSGNSGSAYVTLSASYQESPKTQNVWQMENKFPIADADNLSESDSTRDDLPSPKMENDSKEINDNNSVTKVTTRPISKERQESRVKASTGVRNKTSNRKVIFKKVHTSTDNKKLRHREVEKNRHRQLQAMVKTLSEQIPGKVDKETQVQTMKRAARYCTYLRDVLTSLAHGSTPMDKEKLERIYTKSCDGVELIMAQQMSAR